MSKKRWSLAYWLSILSFFIAYPMIIVLMIILFLLVLGIPLSPSTTAERTNAGEAGFAVFLLAQPLGIIVMLIWIKQVNKIFKKSTANEKDQTIADISREEAITRMQEHYKRDIEQRK